MRRFLLGVMVAMPTALAAGPVAVAQETYKIGAVLAVTGPAFYLGEDERNTPQIESMPMLVVEKGGFKLVGK
jgi:hypothetical protein